MRRDYYSTHMATHIRELLKLDPHQVAESVENHDCVVFQRKRRTLPDGQSQDATMFACCLVCGKHDQCLAAPWRFQHKQWCEPCKSPFESECECGRRSKLIQQTQLNRCDEFIERHNSSCGGQWDSIKTWFDLKRPAPKLKISNRKTERKQQAPRKQLKPADAAPVVAAPVVAAPAPVADDESIRKLILSVFAEEFEVEEDSDEEDEEPIPTPIEMLQKLHRSLTSSRKQLQILNKNMDARVKTIMESKLASMRAEMHEVEQERISETSKLNQAQHTISELHCEIRQLNRNLTAANQSNTKLKHTLSECGIEFDDDE